MGCGIGSCTKTYKIVSLFVEIISNEKFTFPIVQIVRAIADADDQLSCSA